MQIRLSSSVLHIYSHLFDQVKKLLKLSEKLFLTHAFVETTVDDINITKVISHDEKLRHESIKLGSVFYKQRGLFHGIFDGYLVNYI